MTTTDTLIVGASFSGLACAACLLYKQFESLGLRHAPYGALEQIRRDMRLPMRKKDRRTHQSQSQIIADRPSRYP